MGGTVYTLADASFYLGAVALLNSLRLSGNELPVVVIDGGLTEGQRLVLAEHATIVAPPVEARRGSALTKAHLAALEPTGVVIWIDADCIVTGRLGDVAREAESGGFCAARDDWPAGFERCIPEWQDAFQLRAEPRRTTYVNSGFWAMSVELLPHLLPRLQETATLYPTGVRLFRGDPASTLYWGSDQDMLNAILMSEYPESTLRVLPEGAMAYGQWRDARVVDAARLVVEARGTRSTVVHFTFGPKPWQPGGWRRIGREPLLPLVGRCLVGDDLLITPDPAEVPFWLHHGARHGAARGMAGTLNAATAPLERGAVGAFRALGPEQQRRVRAVRDVLFRRARRAAQTHESSSGSPRNVG